MPELPEVERTRLSLAPIIGRVVMSASLLRTDICECFDSRGAPTRPATRGTTGSLLQAARITHLSRKGKQLAIHASDGRTLCIQLGMSGRVLLCTAGDHAPDPPRHTHARWRFDDGAELLFIDPRRFGGISTYPTAHALHTHRWAALGPDALTIAPGDLALACEGSHRPIKSLLLDQAAIAGVGNIYADESLFRARIHPSTHACALAAREITSLARAVRFILSRAIRAGGSTLRDYADSRGTRGSAQLLHAVYGRGNQPCPVCENPLTLYRLAQRATVFCPRCQPAAVPTVSKSSTNVSTHQPAPVPHPVPGRSSPQRAVGGLKVFLPSKRDTLSRSSTKA